MAAVEELRYRSKCVSKWPDASRSGSRLRVSGSWPSLNSVVVILKKSRCD